ncbi:MAG: hypothetical protein IJ187_10630 [Neisseriaceae bacterium]|nr:hypothetical protein [Neisseriaceae bacterium]
MKKILCMIMSVSLLLQTACTTYSMSNQTDEHIKTIFLENDNVYFVGDKNNYAFNKNKNKDIVNFFQYIDTSYFKSSEDNTFIFSIDESSINKNDVKLYISSSIEKDEYLNIKNSKNVLFSDNCISKKYGQGRTYYNCNFNAKGQVVGIKNKDEILNQYAFTNPIKAILRTGKNKIDVGRTVEGAMWIIVLTPIIPLAILGQDNGATTNHNYDNHE